jgi:hypothetical protein
MKEEERYVKKITSFSFQAYQDYDKNKELFDDYCRYFELNTNKSK